MSVTLCSYGAARTVTGSRHQLSTPYGKILLDCGLFQGARHESNERNRHVAIEADAVLLSHAHIDHSGALPGLVKNGFRGPIFATPATKDLCGALLTDVAKIAAADVRHLRKHRRDQDAVEPMYTQEDVDRTMKLFVTFPYGEHFQVREGVRARFQDAGHIIGSAGILVEIWEGPSVYFTGDLGRRMYPILEDPEPLPDSDVILSECTYGTREHGAARIAEEVLVDEIKRCVEAGSKLFIPAFSVGRTQNIVYAMAQHWKSGDLPELPVFVDSPLASKATQVFVDHPELWDVETSGFMDEGGRPFHPRNVRYIASVDESKALNERSGPFVVIAGSGMCEGGRIVHHLLHGLQDPDNTVLFAGWCAPRTLGRRIVDGNKRVRIFGSSVEVKARVASIGAYSAHADRKDLLEFLEPAKARRSRIVLVHGERDTCFAFKKTLEEVGHREVMVPETYAVHALQPR